MSIGQRIRQARIDRGMDQAAFAEAMQVSRTAVAQWETDITAPSIPRFEAAAKILGVTPEYLAFGVGGSMN